jgi:hypothetical protein
MKKEEIRKQKLLGRLKRNARLRSDAEKAENARKAVADAKLRHTGFEQADMTREAGRIDAGLTKSYKVSDWKRR